MVNSLVQNNAKRYYCSHYGVWGFTVDDLTILVDIFGNLAPTVIIGYFFWVQYSKLLHKYIDLLERSIDALNGNTTALKEIQEQHTDNRIINRAMVDYFVRESNKDE